MSNFLSSREQIVNTTQSRELSHRSIEFDASLETVQAFTTLYNIDLVTTELRLFEIACTTTYLSMFWK